MFHLLHIQVTPFEQELITSLTKLQDKIKYRVLTPNDVQVNVSDEEVRNYWEKNKNQSLVKQVGKLKHLSFFNQLGTFYNRTQRLRKLAGMISEQLNLSKEKIEIKFNL